MPWLMFALAVGCLTVAFRTHSMALAAITLIAALGLMLAGTLALVSARIALNARGESEMMSAEEMRLIAESMRRKREAEGGATPPGVLAAAPGKTPSTRDPKPDPDGGADSGAD
jgi:hypothetical protein